MAGFRTCLRSVLMLISYLPFKGYTNDAGYNFSCDIRTSGMQFPRKILPADRVDSKALTMYTFTDKGEFPEGKMTQVLVPRIVGLARAPNYVHSLKATRYHLTNKKKLYTTFTPDIIGTIALKTGKPGLNLRDTSEANGRSKRLPGKFYITRRKRSDNQHYDSSTISRYSGTTEPNINIEDLIQNDTCRSFSTCELASRKKMKFCNCDPLCSIYNDCCLNANVTNINSEYTFDCVVMTSYAVFFGVQIIRECPENMTGTDIDLKCKDSSVGHVGPWVIDDGGIVYQNKFCAECFNSIKYRSFGMNFSTCNSRLADELQNSPNATTEERLKIISKRCQSFAQIPPEGSILRRCLIVTYVNENNGYCNNYPYNPILVTPPTTISIGLLYRNKFCVPESRQNWLLTCVSQSDILNHDEEDDYRAPLMFPLSILFTSELLSDGCVDKNGGLCKTDELMIANAPTQVSFDLVLPTNWTQQQKLQVTQSLMLSFPSQVEFKIVTCYMYKGTTNIACQMLISLEKALTHALLLEYQAKMLNYKWKNMIRMPDGTVVDTYASPFTVLDMANVTKLFSASVRTFKFNHVTISANRTEYTCLSQLLESEIINETLIVKNIRCLENIVVSMTTTPSQIIKISLTYVGLGLSVLSLSVSIILHRKTGMCESVPGSNLENSSVSMLLFTLIFLVGVGAIDYNVVCFTVGVALHYTWMTMFAFKSITLIHICCNLTKFSNLSADETRANRRKCTVIGLIIPLPVLVSAVVFDIFGFPGSKVHYGGSVCFPNGYPANLIFVLGPIGLSVLTNICCFLFVICIISMQSFHSRKMRKTSSYKHLPIIARLSAVTGIFWITGVLLALFPSEILEYVFLVSCSFQGLFVAMSNLSTKRSVRYIREKISSKSTEITE